MPIKIRKEYMEIHKNWNDITKKYGLSATDQRISFLLKKRRVK